MKKAAEHKQKLAVLLVLLLCFAAGIAIINGASQEDLYLRVGLFYGSDSLSSVEVKSEAGFILMSEQDGELVQIKSLTEYPTLIATTKSGAVILKDNDGTIISNAFASENILMSAAEDIESRYVAINGAVYRDGVSFLTDGVSGITVINDVTVEHYIKGVLNAEMSYVYPTEALKAQAVTARSYALANIGKHKKYGFDLCASNCCQVYKGVSAEHDETNYACEATKGLVMRYDGKIVAGYYFANSGGYTQNSEDVWPSALGYLRAVKDDFAPLYAWTGQISFDELKTKLEKAGYSPGAIRAVYVNGRYESGYVAEFVIEGTSEKITLTKEKIRTTLGSSVIKSARFSMGSSESPIIKTEAADSLLSVYSSSGSSSLKNAMYVISAGGQVSEVDFNTAAIYDGTEIVNVANLKTQETEFIDETVTSGQIFFSGLGYGHGVGMSQSSAREMALQGYEYEDILHYFYTNITIEPVSDRFKKILKETVQSIDSAENIIVIKTLSGCANAAGEAIDTSDYPEIIGTIAGDNTMLVIVDKKESVPRLLETLREIIL